MNFDEQLIESLEIENLRSLEDIYFKLTGLLDEAIDNPDQDMIQFGNMKIPNLTMERLTSEYVSQEVRDNYKYVIEDLLKERYMREGEENEVAVFWRVANAIADDEIMAKIYFAMMRLRLFMPATPTLMNAGRDRGMLSSCFVIIPEDSMDSITDYYKEMVLVQKYGGGVGTDWSAIRPEGSAVAGTGGIASGFKAFFEAANVLNETVKQGSARSGANASTMRVDHPEIFKFIDLKKNDPQKYGFFNISVTVNDDQFEKILNDQEITLTFNDSVYDTISGSDIMDRVAENAWKTGDPSWYFLDRVNEGMWDNFVKGRLNPWGVCYDPRCSHNPCLSGDTMISTANGYQPIKSLVGTDTELFIDDTTDAPQEILLTREDGEVYEVILDNGMKIEATLDHKFPTDEGIKTLEEIIDKELSLILDLSEKPFGNGGTLEEGEIAGYFAGDGSEYKNRIYLYSEGLEYFGDQFYDYYVSKHTSNGKPRGVVNIGDNFKYELGHSRFVGNYYNMSREFLRGYLRGLASADGSVYNANGSVTVAFHSNSWEFLQDVQLVLNQFGLYSKIYNEKEAETKEIRGEEFNFKETFKLLLQGSEAKKFIEDIGFSVDYKQDKAIELLADYSPYSIDRRYCSIKSVEFKGVEPVYDVRNFNNHIFVAQGLRTHNCGEQNLSHHGVCNLGSINLFAMTQPHIGYMNWELFTMVTRMATRFLDAVIDKNWFPVKEIEQQSKHLRNIGLGFMGLADFFYLNEIDYNDPEATELAEYITEKMTKTALTESKKLAEEKGKAPVFEERNCPCYAEREDMYITHHEIEKIRNNCPHYNAPLRNSDVTCVAPTGSIRLISSASGGLEPYFMVSYEKLVYPKGTRQIEKYITVMAQAIAHFPDKKNPLTAMDLTPREHIDILASVSKNVTNAVSKTVNCPNDTTVEEIKELYKYAYEKGVKSLSIYRDGCRSDEAQRAIKDTEDEEKNSEGDIIEEEKSGLEDDSERKSPTHEDIDNPKYEMENKNMNNQWIWPASPQMIEIVEGEGSQSKPKMSGIDKEQFIKVSCPSCGSTDITFQEGCHTCMACNWSACSA